MKKMTTWDSLWDSWGQAKLARDMGVSAQVAYNWRQRGYIPHKHWPKLLAKARRNGIDLTLPKLVNLYDNREKE